MLESVASRKVLSSLLLQESTDTMEDLRRVAKEVDLDKESKVSAESQKSLLNLQKEDFLGASLDGNDAVCFATVLPNCDVTNVKTTVIKAVAELAKEEKNRDTLLESGIMSVLLKEIETDDHDITIQCFRAIGNICMENDKGQEAVLKSGYIGKILEKFKSMASISDNELGNLPAMAYGCVNNISDDNESLQAEMVKQGAMAVFLNCVKAFIEKDSEMTELVISALCALACSEAGTDQFIKLNIVEELLSFVKGGNEKVVFAIFDSLTELTEDDDLSDQICQEKCLLTIMDAAEARPSFKESKDTDKVLKKIVDSLVLYTSNESFNVANSDTTLLKRFLSWLQSPNKQIEVAAALAIGNYARNDEVCTDLVKNGIHHVLIDFLSNSLGTEEALEQQQAVLSAIKNISIPAVNKPILADTKLPECACQAVKTPHAAVQFKALAILRLLVQGQAELAVRLCHDDELLSTVADCSEREVIVGLCAEARRLTAALIKNYAVGVSMESLLNQNAMRSLMGLLSSDHMIMQNEGVVAIVSLLTSSTGDPVDKFLAADGIEKTSKMLKQSSNKPHLVFNLMSLFTAMCQTESGKKALHESDILKDVHELANSPNEMIQTRCNELLSILKR